MWDAWRLISADSDHKTDAKSVDMDAKCLHPHISDATCFILETKHSIITKLFTVGNF